MYMSTDLTVQTGLQQTPQPVVDQDGNPSSLYLGSTPGQGGGPAGFVGIAGPGGGGATATLSISTYAELNQLAPNVQVTATDQGDFSAVLAFNLQTPGPGPFNTVLQLLPSGGIQMPHLQQPSSGTVDLVIDGNGNVSPQNSSARFKEDISPLQDDFHKVLLLEPRSFAYRDTGARGIGYTAEEVDAADLHNLVAYDDEGKPLGVHYKMLSIYLLELLKEQQATLAEMQAEIAAFKGLTH
jgi:hypothetical protein